jgi:hypothetical protein
MLLDKVGDSWVLDKGMLLDKITDLVVLPDCDELKDKMIGYVSDDLLELIMGEKEFKDVILGIYEDEQFELATILFERFAYEAEDDIFKETLQEAETEGCEIMWGASLADINVEGYLERAKQTDNFEEDGYMFSLYTLWQMLTHDRTTPSKIHIYRNHVTGEYADLTPYYEG